MEYEIDDDPQGVPDRPDGDRDGGLRDTLFFRKQSRANRGATDEWESPVEQMGELA